MARHKGSSSPIRVEELIYKSSPDRIRPIYQHLLLRINGPREIINGEERALRRGALAGGGRRGESEDAVGDGDVVVVGAVAYHAGS